MDFNKKYADEQIRRSKHPLRRIIKHFYLKNVLKDVKGIAIDLGCGAGQLLNKLPNGSIGLELNRYLVKQLAKTNMNIFHYDVLADDCQLSLIKANQFDTLIISHVMEHFEDAAYIMKILFYTAFNKGISRIIIVVPGKLGYQSDNTHKTFINSEYIAANRLDNISGYQLSKRKFFPFPNESSGTMFIYQELKLVYDRVLNQ